MPRVAYNHKTKAALVRLLKQNYRGTPEKKYNCQKRKEVTDTRYRALGNQDVES